MINGCNNNVEPDNETAKYVFFFIGDGMGAAQINAASLYLNRDTNNPGFISQEKVLEFTKFPVLGSATAYSASSFIPDSAAAATALSCGIKTLDEVLGMGYTGTEPDREKIAENIAEIFNKAGKKVGIISNVSLDHSTPASFFAHVESRFFVYEIITQLGKSGFDFFAGGSLLKQTETISATEKSLGYSERGIDNSWDYLSSMGYTITKTNTEFEALNKNSGRIFAQAPNIQDSASMNYSIDNALYNERISLSEIVKKGIEVLENPNGFFMMVESGKIDWACHANDAATVIHEMIEFDNAVNEAYKFYLRYPKDTLIIVTGDHETGGMSMGHTTSGYNTAFKVLEHQEISHIEMGKHLSANRENYNTMDDLMPWITSISGLTKPDDDSNGDLLIMSPLQFQKLQTAFDHYKNGSGAMSEEEFTMLYSYHNPISITITRILNNKAGIGWTTWYHTAAPVPVYVIGAGASKFNGAYDNTDIFIKLREITKL